MTITHTTETGRELTAPSEEALEAGWEFYNASGNTKADFAEYCAGHGIDILEGDGTVLVEDWAEVVAYTYATHGPAA
jgi:hypothetical protein